MRNTIYLLLLSLTFFSCRKNKDIAIAEKSISLDSLETLTTDIPNARYTDLTFITATTGFAISAGFIVKTTDGGATWTSSPLPTSVSVKKVQFTDNLTGYIIGGNNASGVLFKTTDGGKNWIAINLKALECPYGMYFLNNNTGFITGKNLFIKTTDGGQTWTSLNSNFRMFQDVCFRDKNKGYVTSNKGVAFRTTNGGISWDSLQCNATDYLYDIYFIDDKSYALQSSGGLVDFEHNNAVTPIPDESKQLYFFSSKKSFAIGYHYDSLGFFPHGDILITNDGWKTSTQKNFTDVITFSTIAKMTDNKAMILGSGFTGATVMILTR
jgi:photosystem II stability/assembly factor-like uncharacterized protein